MNLFVFWESIKDELTVFLLSAMPVSELRGSIPLGISMGIPTWETYFLSVAGSLLPAPVLLIFLQPFFGFLRKTVLFRRLIDWSLRRSAKKSHQIKKYGIIGLFLFVAVPLPSTGVWTGCIAASLLGLKFWQAFPAVAAGNMVAGLLVLTISHQII
ncbi:MAG: hypothetical protein PWQ82_1613 [Thermosediminibacterales bacterium]|nr:hypothetical protein [Thermosediminibacterales bacterium]